MTEAERTLVKAIVRGYLGTWSEAAGKSIMKELENGDPENIRFAWSGSERRDAPHYWRITSPVLVVEYWNGRADANHAHAVLRTLHGEFPIR